VRIEPIPAPRRDRRDRAVAGSDREMTRIGSQALARLAGLSVESTGVPVEAVIRFGALGREVRTGADAFGADLISVAAPLPPAFRDARWPGIWRG
jgi:hypothetical protein